MLGKKVIVRKGDSLWKLAEQYLGSGRKWRTLLDYNNSPDVVKETKTRIIDPDLIFIGQTLYIPGGAVTPAPSPTPAPVPKKPSNSKPSARPQPKPSAQRLPQDTAKQRANDLVGIPLKYDLQQLPEINLISPVYLVKVKMTGSITIQAKKAVEFAEITPEQLKITAKREADMALQKLVSECEAAYNPATGEVEFEMGITLHSKMKYAPSFKIATAVSSSGLPVIKASTKYPPIKGEIGLHHYASSDFGVVIEFTKRPESPRPQPQPITQPVLERKFNWDYAIGTGLLIGAGVIVIATVAEDIATLGLGIADDAPSFAAASAMFAGGLAMYESVNGGQPIKTYAEPNDI